MSMIDLSHVALTAAFAIYLVSLLANIASFSFAPEILRKIAIGTLSLGWIAHTAGLGARWIAAGFSHPPMTNMYETLLLFVWGFVLISVYFDMRYRVRVQSALATLIALVGLGLASLQQSKEIEPLVPALQSLWLHVHVAFAAFSYGFFLLSSLFAFLFIIKLKPREHFVAALLQAFAAFCLLVVGGKGTMLLGDIGFSKLVEIEGKLQISGDLIAVPYLKFAFSFVFLLLVVTVWLQSLAEKDEKKAARQLARWFSLGAFMLSLAVVATVFFVLTHTPGLELRSNPYRLILLVLGLLGQLVSLILHWSYDSLRSVLPEADTLEQLSYKAVLIGVPLLTVVICTGSVWAHYAWGRYWGWDPKETWSLITWLIYALYLHLRLQRGWQGLRLAIVSIVGFFAVIFTYMGVNILLSGLHAYG